MYLDYRAYVKDYILENTMPAAEWHYDFVIRNHMDEAGRLLTLLEHVAKNFPSAVNASGYFDNSMKVTILERSPKGEIIKVHGDYSYKQSIDWKGWVELYFKNGQVYGVRCDHYQPYYASASSFCFLLSQSMILSSRL